MVRRSQHGELRAHRPHPGPHHASSPGDLLDEVVDDQHAAGAPARTRSTTSPRSRFVQTSFGQPVLTGEVTGARRHPHPRRHPASSTRSIRFYQASLAARCSARCSEVPQSETTPFYPRSPYGVAKVYGHWITVNYRESYDLLRQLGHPVQPREPAPRPRVRHPQDQPRASRGSSSGCSDELRLGNLDAQRDWGFAGDYVEAMWLMLQQDEPDDYVVSHRRDALGARVLRDRVRPRRTSTGSSYVVVDERFMRPAEVDLLVGDRRRRRGPSSAGSRGRPSRSS